MHVVIKKFIKHLLGSIIIVIHLGLGSFDDVI